MKYLNWKFWLILLMFILLPLGVNLLSCISAPFVSWENPSEWTKLWVQYISGLAAFAMLYVAWRTLLATKEVNRPYVIIDIVERSSFAYIRCRNIGHISAQNIRIQFEAAQLNDIKLPQVKKSFESIQHTPPFVLEPNGKRIWEIFCIPSYRLDLINDSRFSSETKYEFKGEKIAKDSWLQNEDYFKSLILKCYVYYNDYSNEYYLDYNNRLFDYEPAQLISDSISNISFGLGNLKWPIDQISNKYCADDKTK